MSKKPVHHNASKHIDVWYHFVRDYVISRKIGLEKISTADNVVDGIVGESGGRLCGRRIT